MHAKLPQHAEHHWLAPQPVVRQSPASRMQTLINDLLTFSRVTTKAQPFVPVDLNRVAGEVLHDLEGRIHETQAEIIVGDLPTIVGALAARLLSGASIIDAARYANAAAACSVERLGATPSMPTPKEVAARLARA